jgi:hypothetical protein
MKAAIRSALALALVATLLSLTQTASAGGDQKGEKKVSGEITAVDTKANTITIKHKTDSMTFALASDVKFGSGGENMNLNLSNLKVGDKVNIHYTEDAGKMFAHKVGHVDVSAKKESKEEKKASQ